MEFDATWMLLGLPLAFVLGWLASRFDLRQLRAENRRAPKAYFKGLNFLLNEQQDQAIDAFIEAVQNDPDTSELHFALGNLFRRRGEYERAIRVHQHLLARADLSASDHDRARAAARAGQILPLPKVLASIRPNYPGEVLDVDLEQSGERWLYEIKLLQDGGQLRKLIVDASTGTVLLDRVPLGRRWRRKLQADEAAPPALGQHQHRRGACGPSGCPAPAAAAAPTSPPPQAPKP